MYVTPEILIESLSGNFVLFYNSVKTSSDLVTSAVLEQPENYYLRLLWFFKENMENRRLVVAREDEQDDRTKTFIFKGEGHTLGNALRTLILKNPDVIFCGYTIPHPSENKLHLRIETKEMSAVDALREGLEQLQSLSDYVLETFETAVSDFKSKQMEM
uniref:DNA-directed RNA polymerases I and III subunit RPAC2 n=2 Tax=Daphnia similis TaxID=35528 RepID=A0A4Y7LUM7_9CRUS|nr:EOG090X0LBP [Daphnia similis]SVE72096.1 EOG090X0LBP [Daphnia similis]SVE72723.1 EOG090X0LBP [Daphnia similis]